MPEKELLFSVTASDCKWDYFRCPGKGGQKVNKTSSGVRCTHPPSGAVGKSCDERSQHINRRKAFERMVNSEKFRIWHRMEVAKRTGVEDAIRRKVEREMKNVRIEVKDERGRWVEISEDELMKENDDD